MKCSNPHCNRGIGLIAHRRWFSKQRYCSKSCRNAFMPDLPNRSNQGGTPSTTHFKWLFLQTD
jgi:hypothetical protein